jgi:phospholipid/cholesterol/gamma-HCH transport system ATP-binding protein
MIEYLDLYKRFDVPVLAGVSLSVAEGETLSILGPSGTGKSVLLKTTIGLIVPERGDVRIEGDSVFAGPPGTLERIRRKIRYVFQYAALFDSLSVYENVAMGLPEADAARLDERAVLERIAESLENVNLDPHLVLRKLPAELSGGMRKRVGIARALIGEPAMLLFDEPTAGLDPTNSRLVAELIVRLRGGVCDTAIVVTHDLELTRTVADRVAVLIDGQFAALGPRDEVLASDHPAVQAFLAGEAR